MARDLDVGYLGVVVDDRDPQVVFDNMVAAVQERLPDWVARNASLDVVLLEAFAVGVADWIYASNRSVGALVEAVLAGYGVPRDEGQPAEGSLALTFDGSVTDLITEGTAFITDDGITLLAVRDTPVSGASVTVDVAEAIPGEGSLLGVGDALSPVAGIPQLSTCELSVALSGGRPAEDDATYLARASMRLQRVTSAAVLPEHFTALALEDPRVGRATTINLWDADTETETAGHVTVALFGKGAALDTEVIDELQASFSDQAATILIVHVIGAERPTVDMAAGITVAAGYDSADVSTACEDALTEWLSWGNAGFGQTVTPTAIEAILGNVAGVSTAVCTVPAGDVTHDAWEMPDAGTVTISV